MNIARFQKGASLITAIFLIVLLVSLGAFLVTVSGLQQTSSALDIQGSRAYQAARAGIEWGAFRALQNSGACASSSAATSFSPGGNLSGFTVTVDCQPASFSEAGATIAVYRITANACSRPSAGICPGTVGQNYVERELQATIAK